MSQKTKKITREQALAAMVEASQETALIGEITQRMNLEIAEIKEEYRDTLKSHEAMLENARDMIESYVMQEKDELFTDTKRSCEFGVGKIGLRKSPAKLITLDGWTLTKVIDKIKKTFADNYNSYIRTSEDLDKTNIKKLTTSELKKVGLAIEQEEKVTIEF